jgi:hypothetical protein
MDGYRRLLEQHVDFDIVHGQVEAQDCHGLGYFWILLAMSWPRIFWDTFGNIMA